MCIRMYNVPFYRLPQSMNVEHEIQHTWKHITQPHFAYWLRAFSKLRKDLSKLPVSVFTWQICLFQLELKSNLCRVNIVHRRIFYLFFALFSTLCYLKRLNIKHGGLNWIDWNQLDPIAGIHGYNVVTSTSLTLFLISLGSVFPEKRYFHHQSKIV